MKWTSREVSALQHADGGQPAERVENVRRYRLRESAARERTTRLFGALIEIDADGDVVVSVNGAAISAYRSVDGFLRAFAIGESDLIELA